MNWESPALYDRNWRPWSFEEARFLQSIPIDTVIAVRQHQYEFDGSYCGGMLWGPYLHEVWLDLTVEQVLDAEQNPVVIPSSSPPRFLRVAVWKLR